VPPVSGAGAVRAWRTLAWGEVESIVFAASRAKARAATLRAAKEADFIVDFTGTEVRVVRAPEYDGLAAVVQEGKAFAPDYLPDRLLPIRGGGLIQ